MIHHGKSENPSQKMDGLGPPFQETDNVIQFSQFLATIFKPPWFHGPAAHSHRPTQKWPGTAQEET